jgi:hypothetical protein
MDMHLSEELERRIDDQELDARATAFQAEIDKRLNSGPAMAMDFAALKKSIREGAEARKAERG